MWCDDGVKLSRRPCLVQFRVRKKADAVGVPRHIFECCDVGHDDSPVVVLDGRWPDLGKRRRLVLFVFLFFGRRSRRRCGTRNEGLYHVDDFLGRRTGHIERRMSQTFRRQGDVFEKVGLGGIGLEGNRVPPPCKFVAERGHFFRRGF